MVVVAGEVSLSTKHRRVTEFSSVWDLQAFELIDDRGPLQDGVGVQHLTSQRDGARKTEGEEICVQRNMTVLAF